MIGGANFPRYRNANVDRLIGQADSTLDSATRANLYRQAQHIVVDEVPSVVLFQLDWQRAVRSDIVGVNYNFSQPTFYNFEGMSRAGDR